MKKTVAFVISVIVALVLFAIVITLVETFMLYLGGIGTLAAFVIAILGGNKFYAYLSQKWKVQGGVDLNITTGEGKIRKMILYTLLTAQLVFSIGYPNEFDDYIMLFVVSIVFFLAEIGILIRFIPTRSVTVFVVAIGLLQLFGLLAFINDGVEIISNNYPAEMYYETYHWVILMFTACLLLEAIKLVVLYRKKLFLILSKDSPSPNPS